MRWFKHLSYSQNDENMSELMDKFGAEGYGVWWLILERIAQLMDKTSRTSARLSVKVWAKSCRISAKNFQKLVTFLEKKGIFWLNFEDEYLTIDCPNLSKYRDEWSTRRDKLDPKTRDKLPSNSRVTPVSYTDTDTETEKDSIPLTPFVDSLTAHRPKEEIQIIFDFWKETMGHPSARLDKKRKRLVTEILKLGYKSSEICDAILGCSIDPFHMGKNDRGKVFDDLSLICRDATHIDKFIKILNQSKNKNLQSDIYDGF